MSNDNVKISYDGFIPESEEKSLVSAVMRKIEYDAPSDSTIYYKVQKTWAGYLGYCRIVSGIGVFEAENESKTIEQLTAAIEKKIYENLNFWKSNRFKNNNTLPLGSIVSAS